MIVVGKFTGKRVGIIGGFSAYATLDFYGRLLYSRTLARYNIACVEPEKQYWEEIRYFIECVKQNKYDNELKDRFLRFTGRYDVDNIILGCTEFPVLLRHIDMGEGIYNFYDPLTYAIQEIHRRIS